MKKSCIVLLLVLFSTVFLDGAEQFEASAASNIQDIEWVRCSICDFPVWVVLNSSPGHAIVPRRSVFLFIQDFNFTEGNLERVFTKFAEEYPAPQTLYITAFSDRQMLKQLIKAETSPNDLAGTQEGKELEREYYVPQPYPSKTGCFQAYYYRSSKGEENFHYNPNPDANEYISIKLKDRTDENYTGDLTSDLLLAAKKNDIQKIKELLVRGADVNSKDFQGETALMKARNPQIVKLLLEQGAEVDAKNNYGFTALIKTSNLGQSNIVQILLQRGANINSKNKYGNTALMSAAMNGYVQVVEILLKMGADTTAINNFGKTALMFASERRHTEVVHLLEAARVQK